jgi:ABC-type iron transport system FetAB permease component
MSDVHFMSHVSCMNIVQLIVEKYVLHLCTTLHELIYVAPMYLLCFALIISTVHSCSMLSYKISKSHAKIFDNF